ncbi:clathrin coat assembly protein AP180-like [Telopea speciosissima]|uniref:clathrin coat assembly protein AP180-like n=1 Tax=Telopea speciosissima TaxID=54955 RepID=UPI001CC508E7|nr:clathrin coat assembly protein AP180-like [Telopea speciosissima]
MPSKLRKAIGVVKDQTSISLAMVSKNNSSNLDIAVLKATTHDVDQLKEKHVKSVLQVTSSSKLCAAACAQVIAKRIGRTRNWIVALKCLMLVFRIFRDGDPYFPHEVLQAMKGGAKILNLSTFRDDSNSSPWDYTAYVRTFALYLDERLACFLMGKLHRRAVYKDSNSGSRRSNDVVCDMNPPILIDRISYWQRLLDRAIATRPTGAAKSNRLVHISLYSIVQESFDLYRDISDGLTLLLDSFFQLQYQSCVDAFQTCIKASKQFEELSEFYTSCKNMGVGRTSEYPSVQKIADELIDALREFLKDQASFPVGNSRSTLQSPPLLLPAPPPLGESSASNSGRLEPSEKQQLETSEQLNEEEDQISEGTSPSIPTDQDQFEKQSQLDDLMMGLNTITSTNEAGTGPSASSVDQGGEDGGREGWEFMLGETANDNSVTLSASQGGFAMSSVEGDLDLDASFQQPSYNPFLQDTSGIGERDTTAHGDKVETAIVPVAGDTGFSSLPTFQVTPTFCVQKSEDSTASTWDVENDPFAPLPTQTDQILGNSTSQQQHFLREQQLWLHHQNKIIAKHANVV